MNQEEEDLMILLIEKQTEIIEKLFKMIVTISVTISIIIFTLAYILITL